MNKNRLFVLILVIISMLYGFLNTLNDPPYSTHQWRQADGLSIAINYYHEGMNFFEPKIHLQNSVQGRAVGEFPIVYYIDALIWKITGPSFAVFRLINLLICLCGLYALYKASLLLLKDFYLSITIPIIVFSSPLFGFYSNNFMVNLPALSLVFIAWYYLLKYWKSRKTIHIILFSMLITLSVLLRATMIIGLVPILLIYFLEIIGYLKLKVFDKKIFHGILLSIPIVAICLWMMFVKAYNASNGSCYFLTTTVPIWELDSSTISRIWTRFLTKLILDCYHSFILLFSLLILCILLIYRRRQHNYLFIFFGCVTVELVFYLLFWFKNIDVHDYYLIELLLFFPPLLLVFFHYLKKEYVKWVHSAVFRVAIGIVVLFSLCYGITKVKIRYTDNTSFFTTLFLQKDEIEYWQWYHWDYSVKHKANETITPYLRSLGIKREDFVISIPDISPNVTLSLMDQKGFTSLYFENRSIKEQIEAHLARGAKYLIINDTTLYKKEDFAMYLQHKIGRYENIEIFDLDNMNHHKIKEDIPSKQ